MSRLAAAEEYAGDVTEPGFEAARETARAWAAGVDPEATVSLISAAAILAGPAAKRNLIGPQPPRPSSVEYIEAVTDLESDLHDLGRRGVKLGDDVLDDLATARKERAAAETEARRARMAAASCTAADARAEWQARAEKAQARARAARRVIGDCEAAAEVIEAALGTVNMAIRAIQAVPEDFAEYFDVPLALAAAGHRMPRDGYFFGQGEAA